MMQNLFARREFTGYHMVAVMTLFFGTIISVNLLMAWYANTSWSGLVVKNSYVASQEFNGKLEEARRQEALGWKADIDMTGKGISLFLHDGAGKPLEVLAIEAKAFHRKAAATGVPVTLSGAGGAWSSAQEFVPGLWRIEVDATLADGQRFEKTYELTLK